MGYNETRPFPAYLPACPPAVSRLPMFLLGRSAGSVFGCALLAAAVAFSIAPVHAADASSTPKFELDVMPILTVAGCNSGPCHGKSRGQNGFQLSLLGFDADFDYASIVEHARGRRVSPAAPSQSLLLLKGAGLMPHGGGERLEPSGSNYDVIRRWVAAGAPRSSADDPKLVGIELTPRDKVLQPKTSQPLRVSARYSDGSTRDVTALTTYQSNESPVAAVDAAGIVTAGALPGETAVMARYMNFIAVFNVAVPQTGTVDRALYSALPRRNFIDEAVWKRLERLGITPSQPCDDATFLRRAHLDVIGRLPTVAEARVFLDDTSENKRAALVDKLLARPEYADHWANKWVDLLRPNPYRVGMKTVMSFDVWIRDAFRTNKPYDQFVHDLLTARGSTWRNGATVLFRDRRTPEEITTMACQLFLGVRLDCARCHHHPFEVWGQDEFFGTAAYFARVGYKGTGISAPISGSEEFIFTAVKGSVKHPLSGADVEPKPLSGAASVGTDEDPREALVRWMLDEKNPYFAHVAVNRIWTEIMGRGIVEPVDDLRATNPPTNPELIDALAREFRESNYDVKQLIRTILTSEVYGLSSLPNDRNAWDLKNYSRHYRKQLRAETLLDAVVDVTGVDEKFEGMPAGSRAVELWTHRIDNLFLDSFGRPDPNQDPPCERTGESTLVQSLHLMNAPVLHAKVTSDEGRVAKLLKQNPTPRALVEELYLSVYSRFPTGDELAATTALFEPGKPIDRTTAEDLLWALLNSPEFTFKN